MVLDRPRIFRRLILVGTAPRGGEDIMHLEKPRLRRIWGSTGQGVRRPAEDLFTRYAGRQPEPRCERIAERKRGPGCKAGPGRECADQRHSVNGSVTGERLGTPTIQHPTLVVNEVRRDDPIDSSPPRREPAQRRSPAYPDAGTGAVQYHESFARQSGAFLSVSSESAVLTPQTRTPLSCR
jgi:hypothetical protein